MRAARERESTTDTSEPAERRRRAGEAGAVPIQETQIAAEDGRRAQ